MVCCTLFNKAIGKPKLSSTYDSELVDSTHNITKRGVITRPGQGASIALEGLSSKFTENVETLLYNFH